MTQPIVDIIIDMVHHFITPDTQQRPPREKERKMELEGKSNNLVKNNNRRHHNDCVGGKRFSILSLLLVLCSLQILMSCSHLKPYRIKLALDTARDAEETLNLPTREERRIRVTPLTSTENHLLLDSPSKQNLNFAHPREEKEEEATATTTQQINNKAPVLSSTAGSTSSAIVLSPSNVSRSINSTDKLLYLLRDVPHPEMKCYDTTDPKLNQKRCCASWDVNVDEWWTHHPDWRIVSETSQEYCFAKYPEPEAAFYRKLYIYNFLWDGPPSPNDENATNFTDGMEIYQRDHLPPATRYCKNVFRKAFIRSGVGAAFSGIIDSLHQTYEEQRPYQIYLRDTQFTWVYVAGRPRQGWSWCPSTDLNCFVLPMGNCEPIRLSQDEDESPDYRLDFGEDMYQRFLRYLSRYQHHIRFRIQRWSNENNRKAAEKRKNQIGGEMHTAVAAATGTSTGALVNDINKGTPMTNCTAFHMRRGDSGLHRVPYRRYASLLEYIQAGNVSRDEPIVLLTDDDTTIYEAEHFYPDYTWVYVDKPRQNGTFNGFGGHVPKSIIDEKKKGNKDVDRADEYIAMQGEVRTAARCRKLVHSKSGFVRVIAAAYALAEVPYPETIVINTKVTKAEAEEFKDIDKNLRAQLMIENIYREAAEELKKRTGISKQ